MNVDLCNNLLSLFLCCQDQLTAKRDKLSDQLCEARRLKENIDRRSEAVARTLGRYLGADREAEHRAFLRAKVRLILRARELQEAAQLVAEQVAALQEVDVPAS